MLFNAALILATIVAAVSAETVSVKSGDTCNSIAAAKGTTTAALISANPSINAGCTNLKVGQTLTVGGGGGDAGVIGAPSGGPPAANGQSFGTPPFGPASPFNPATLPPPNPACKRAKRSQGLTIAKRIAQQDLPAVAQSWQDLCLKSGGDIQTNTPCVTLAGDKGIKALLAGSPECAQQENADAMIDFAKSSPSITNKEALIANAIAFRKHPRNTLDIGGQFTPSTPFCQKPPKNQELNGVVNDQVGDGNPAFFGGPNFAIVAFGDPRTCPFGKTPDVATCTCK